MLSPDDIVPDQYNPLDWDRYAYTRNNPVNFTDPTGHMVACDKNDWACQTHWDDPVVEEEPYIPGPLDPVIEVVATLAFDPLDWMATYEACTNGDCNAWMLLFGMVPYLPSSAGKNIPNLYDILKYGDEAAGFAKHHGVLDIWASANIPGYLRRNPDAPTILLDPKQHQKTIDIFNNWRKEVTGSITGAIDWKQVSPQTVQALANKMFDAAGVPQAARDAYFRAFNQYIYGKLP